MKYAIVSTYPREGSQNIGDKLIERATIMALQAVDPDAEFISIWRADDWQNVAGIISRCDHVVFACLAIRKNIAIVYPYLENILDLDIPISAISAGTSIAPLADHRFQIGFSDKDIELLRRFSEKAVVFTSRGAITQLFCEKNGLSKARLSGDVAFWDPRFSDRTFEDKTQIRSIAISDPHAGDLYRPIFEGLVSTLRARFPDARIECLLHGLNSDIEDACTKMNVPQREIYKDPHNGLDGYDEFDLHVGFRVHGHVSALQRCIPSYLLEQDGRGADYGLTLDRKISIPCYRLPSFLLKPKPIHKKPARRLPKLFGMKVLQNEHVDAKPAQKLIGGPLQLMEALLAQDAARNFTNFLEFEKTVARFNAATRDAMRAIVTARH